MTLIDHHEIIALFSKKNMLSSCQFYLMSSIMFLFVFLFTGNLKFIASFTVERYIKNQRSFLSFKVFQLLNWIISYFENKNKFLVNLLCFHDFFFSSCRLTRVGSGSLNIKDIRPEDGGTYQCRAENSLDSIDVASVIEVWRGPRFLEKPKNTVAVEKGDIELVCQVEAEPQATVQWWENYLYFLLCWWCSLKKPEFTSTWKKAKALSKYL